jgi:hypothetical protein
MEDLKMTKYINESKNNFIFLLVSVGLFLITLTFIKYLYHWIDLYSFHVAMKFEFKLIIFAIINIVVTECLALYVLSIILRFTSGKKVRWLPTLSLIIFLTTFLTITISYFNYDFFNHKELIVKGMTSLIKRHARMLHFIYLSPDIIRLSSILTCSVSIGVGYFYILKKIIKEQKVDTNNYSLEDKNIQELSPLAKTNNEISWRRFMEINFKKSMLAFLNAFFEFSTLIVLFKESEYKKIFKKGVTPPDSI